MSVGTGWRWTGPLRAGDDDDGRLKLTGEGAPFPPPPFQGVPEALGGTYEAEAVEGEAALREKWP